MNYTISALNFNIHNITFTTYMTCLTSFKVSHIFHSYMTKVHLSYLFKTSHTHISFMHISCKGYKSTKHSYTLLHIAYYYFKHLGMTLILLMLSYTSLYHNQYNNHDSYKSNRSNHVSTSNTTHIRT